MTRTTSSYLRYVVAEAIGPAMAITPTWTARTATAEEAFSILEARLAERLLLGDHHPRLALIDCSEGRLLGWSGKAAPGEGLVRQAIDYARSFAPPRPAAGYHGYRPPTGDVGGAAAPGSPSAQPPVPGVDEADAEPCDPYEEDEPADSFPADIQPLIDAFVREYYACRVNRGLYESLCDNLVDADDPFEFDAEPVRAVTRSALMEVLSLRSPSDVREGLGLGPGKRLRVADWITYVIQVELPNLLEDDDQTRMLGPVLLRDSHGRTVSMIKSLTGGIGGDVEVHWHGARATWADFQRELGRDWITSPEDFARLPAAEQRAIIRKARER